MWTTFVVFDIRHTEQWWTRKHSSYRAAWNAWSCLIGSRLICISKSILLIWVSLLCWTALHLSTVPKFLRDISSSNFLPVRKQSKYKNWCTWKIEASRIWDKWRCYWNYIYSFFTIYVLKIEFSPSIYLIVFAVICLTMLSLTRTV